MNLRPLLLLLLLTWCPAAVIVAAGSPVKTVSIHQVPALVKKTIETQLNDAKLGDIEQDEQEGEVTYTVNTTTKDGDEKYFTVSDAGILLNVQVTLEESPIPVQRTVKKQVADGTLDNLEKTFEQNEITYEVEMTRKDGAERSFTVALDGALTSLQISIEETPPGARKTIEAHAGDGKVENVYHLSEKGAVSYDAEVNKDGKVRDVIVASDGKLESVQVFLLELPAPAQKTIQEKIGAGKIVRIDRDSTPRQGVQPFEVEGRKDGKPFNFSVGPRGRFLGMDE